MVGKFFLKYRWRIFILLLLPWFFIGGPDDEGARMIEETWNLGHILFFAIFALEADKYLTAKHLAIRTRYYSIMFSILGLATGIEVCQSLIPGRVAGCLDIILGLVGGLAVLVWKYSDKQPINKKVVLQAAGIIGIAACMLPLLLVVVDEYRAWRDFPVLSNFESFLDVSRWEAKGMVERVKKPVKIGKYALKVCLNTDKYSGVALVHFPENWSKARALTFSVYNPGETVTLHYRVHDWTHRGKNQDYTERYNGHSELAFGWNTITIGIEEILNAPKSRKMDIKHIRGFGLFLVEQPVERVLYIDDVKLLLNAPAKHL